MEEIRIVIADDHPLFRQGVKQALELDNNLNIVGEASNGKEAFEIIKKQIPDVAVLDINMPFLTGLQVVKKLRDENINVEIVLLTMFDDEDMLNEAMDLGVNSYILKESAALDIVNAVNSSYKGQLFISPSLTSRLLSSRAKLEADYSDFNKLSEKEISILKLIADSKSSKQIADELYISPKTVENYRYKISEKLNLSGSYSLLKFVMQHKHLL